MLAGVPDRADLALDAAHPEAAGTSTPSTPSSCRAAPSGVWQSSLVTHRMLTRASLANPPARSASAGER